MNSKLLGYEGAVEKLKQLEKIQRFFKKFRLQSLAAQKRKEINYLLSIIAAEKRARKLWAEVEYYRSQDDKTY